MITLFITGLFPIVLGFLLLGFLVARIAKKRGKNPWLWGCITVAAITVVSWQQIPIWAANIFYRGMTMTQSLTPPGKITTLAEAKKINFRSSVDGIHFDVPLVYHFRDYNQQLHGWVGVSQGQIEGKERPAVDFINIDALLPDVSPADETNLAEFEVLGLGKKIHASITHMRSWDYYFKNTFGRLQRQPDLPEMPGLLHHYDPLAHADMYFSHDHSTDDLVRIRCIDAKFDRNKFPACNVETSYRPAPELIASKHIEGAIFRLEYMLPRQYVAQWREIDRKLKSLFDQFIKNAA